MCGDPFGVCKILYYSNYNCFSTLNSDYIYKKLQLFAFMEIKILHNKLFVEK